MPEQIIWTPKAKKELIEILEYWIERNGSNRFSSKLSGLIEKELELLLEFPEIGRKTDVPGVRVKAIQKYLLYYEFDKTALRVLTIRHQKRDPDTLELR